MSRLWKVGSIFSRLSGLVDGGQLKSKNIPIWYDIYKRFPPAREPKYSAFNEGDTPPEYTPPKILYDEDTIRQAYYEDIDDGEIIKLKNNDRKSRSQIFIDEYFLLKSKQTSPTTHSTLFRSTLERLQQNGHPIMFKSGAENKYVSSESEASTQSTQKENSAILDENSNATEWERNLKEGYFPLSKNTLQYRRLQPQRIQTTLGEKAIYDGNVTHRRVDGYVHSTVVGDQIRQVDNPYMPGDKVQPLVPPTFVKQRLLPHGKVHNVFTQQQYETDPYLRLQDRVKSLELWKKPPSHTKAYRRKFRAKSFLVDIPGIYDKK